MRSLILSQCRDLRIGVTREDLGALTTCKTVLNQLEAVNLRFRKIVVERVTVVKFRVRRIGFRRIRTEPSPQTPLLDLRVA